MVSIMNIDFLKEMFPGVVIRPVSEISDGNLNVLVANQNKINILGIAILDFGVEIDQRLFQIPFVVTSDKLNDIILGYNTIEHFVTNFKDDLKIAEFLPKVIRSLSEENTDKIVALIKIGEGLVPKAVDAKVVRDEIVNQGSMVKVRCKIKDLGCPSVSKRMLIFSPSVENALIDELKMYETVDHLNRRKKHFDIPVFNPTGCDVKLRKGTVLGEVSEATAMFSLSENQASIAAYINGISEGEEEKG